MCPVTFADAIFNCNIGTITSTGGAQYIASSINYVGDGWYRCSVTANLTSTGIYPNIVISNSSTLPAPTYAGDGWSGFFIWGNQVETGYIATSYIPTISSQVTRAADIATSTAQTRAADVYSSPTVTRIADVATIKSTTNWYNGSQGTYAVTLSGQYADPLPNSGSWNNIISGVGTCVYRYSNNTSYLYTPNGNANPVMFGTAPTTTPALTLAGTGTASIQRLAYYNSDVGANNANSMISGTLVTSWDTNYKSNTNINAIFSSAPYGPNMKYMPMIDTSNCTTVNQTWRNCGTLTSFPSINTSKITGIGFYATWLYNYNLTSFPLIDTSQATSLQLTWEDCQNLTSFPLIDTSNCTDINQCWVRNFKLTSFPLINTSKVTNFYQTWYGCSGFTSFPLLDTSSGTNFSGTWYGCSSLTSFPAINTSKGTNFTQTWYGCTSLVTFPANVFDTCQTINYQGAFQNCALNQTSVDNILVSVALASTTYSLSNGQIDINGGTSSTPSATGLAAKATLVGRGWTVNTN